MTQEELQEWFENGITVAALIEKLKKMPQDAIVVNSCRNHEPVSDINETDVDYCFEEIITRHVIDIW